MTDFLIMLMFFIGLALGGALGYTYAVGQSIRDFRRLSAEYPEEVHVPSMWNSTTTKISCFCCDTTNGHDKCKMHKEMDGE